jgi:CHAT domain-containing protein
VFVGIATFVTSVTAFAATNPGWVPIRSDEVVEQTLSVATEHRLSVCVDQRDLDLTLSLESGSLRHRIDATVFGRECIHALSQDQAEWRLRIEATDKRYGRGSYRIASITRRTIQPTDHQRMAAQALLNSARALDDAGTAQSKEKALDAYSEAAAAAVSAADRRREGESRSNRGALLHSMGRYNEALEEYRVAGRIWSELPDSLQGFVTALDRERIMSQLGRHHSVERLLKNLATWRLFRDQRGIGSAYRGLARMEIARRRHRAAEHYVALAYSSCELVQDLDCQARVLEVRVNLAQITGRATPEEFLQRRLQIAKDLNDARGYAAALGALADFQYDSGRFEESRLNFEEVRRLRMEQGDEPSVAGAEARIGACHRRMGDTGRAFEWALAAFRRIEQLHSSLSGGLLRSEVRWGWIVEAYLDALVAAAQAEEPAACKYASLADEARNTYLSTNSTVSVAIQSVLEPGDIALLFAHTGESAHAWKITREGCSVHLLGDPSLVRLLGRWRDALTNGALANAFNRDMSDRLLSPLLLDSSGGRVIVSATGGFAKVSFSALLDPSSDYRLMLGETREVVYIPSLSYLAQSRSQWSSRNSGVTRIAAFGDPAYGAGRVGDSSSEPALVSTTRDAFGSASLPRLPFSRREVGYVVAESGGRAKPFMGYQANRSYFQGDRLASFDGLHVAAHGLMNPQEPEKSGLVLSLFSEDGKRIPGYLSLPDILAEQRPFRLVVLSGCQTGAGKPLLADPSLSLASAFLRAGSRTVVSSLWKVDDEATSETMKFFYRAYMRDNLSPGAALAYAQREIRKVPKWRSPYYWAGFVVIGDWLR